MTRITCVLVLVAVLAPVAQADEPFVTRSYEIGAIVESAGEALTGHVGLPTPLQTPEMEMWDEDAVRHLTSDALIEWIQGTVQPDVWDSHEYVSIEAIGNRLFVTAPAQTHAEVEVFLKQRWDEAALRIQVDVDWLRFGDAARKKLAEGGLLTEAREGRLPRDGAQRLLAAARDSGSVISSASGWFRPGLHASIRQTTQASFVRDYDVEIAQDSSVGNPIVDAAVGGWVLDLRPFALQNGSVLLETLFQAADIKDPVRRLPLETKPFGTLDFPSARVQRISNATTIAPGDARAWLFESGGELSVILVRPNVRKRKTSQSMPRVFDARALLTQPVAFVVEENADVIGYTHPALFRAPLNVPPTETQIQGILQRHIPAMTNEEQRPSLDVVERQMFVHGHPEFAGEIGRWLGALEESLFKRRRLELRLIEKSESAERVLAATAIDVVLGRPACVQDGSEHAYIADWDVEVAQEARAGDPITAVLFTGWLVNARADAVLTDDIAVLTLDLTYTSADTPFEIRHPENECTGPIEIPKMFTAKIAREISLELGKPKIVDVGSRGGASPTRLELEVVLRK